MWSFGLIPTYWGDPRYQSQHKIQYCVYFTAVAIDGLTTIGSSETVIGAIQPLVKTAASGPFAMYLLPIHCLFVDPQGKVAHGVIGGSGAVSCRVLP